MDIFIAVGQSNMELVAPFLETLLQEKYPGCILVKAAVGGSTIAEWQPGQLYYINAVTQTLAAVALGGVIRAIVMMHGESDANLSTLDYSKKCLNFLDNFRTEIGAKFCNVFYTCLGKKDTSMSAFPAWDSIPNGIKYQQLLMRYQRPGFFMIDPTLQNEYIPNQAPGVHNTPAACLAIAQEFMIPIAGKIK